MRAEYYVLAKACSRIALQAFQVNTYLDDLSEMRSDELSETEKANLREVADDMHKHVALLVLKLDILSTDEKFQ